MTPEVSVVMSVYNAGSTLAATIDSILAQRQVSLEVIVIDDGSSDETAKLLQEISHRDARVRTLRKLNEGLTIALQIGCEMARAPLIARHDAGDFSHPDRLRLQIDSLHLDPDANLCSCHAEFFGPQGERLYLSNPDDPDVQTGRTGPAHHGSVVMRRHAYRVAGGYRSQFYFAQDLDLWTRLAERGRHIVVPQPLYRASLFPGAISGRHAHEQRQLAELIGMATEARRNGQDETPFLEMAARIRPHESQRKLGRLDAAGAYFIGCVLSHRDPIGAREYFRDALRAHPLHGKAWLRLLQSHLLPGTMRRDQ